MSLGEGVWDDLDEPTLRSCRRPGFKSVIPITKGGNVTDGGSGTAVCDGVEIAE
jgi:hypothetical protein